LSRRIVPAWNDRVSERNAYAHFLPSTDEEADKKKREEQMGRIQAIALP